MGGSPAWRAELGSHFLWKLWLCFAVLILLSTGIVGTLVAGQVERSTVEEIDRRLETAARMLADVAEAAPLREDEAFRALVQRMGEGVSLRLTLIGADGRVLADSEKSADSMENHAGRPEVLQAREEGIGRSSRFSHTIERRLRYLAVPVRGENGAARGWARAAVPLVDLDRQLARLRRALFFGAVAAAFVGLGLALLLARRITRPVQLLADAAEGLADGDLGRRVEIEGPSEIRDLADAFNSMSSQLQATLGLVEADRNKLEAILGSMVEGVVAVDRDDRVVHLNRVAGRILGEDPERTIGRPVWEVARSLPLRESLEEAVRTEATVHRVARLSARDERWIDLRACPLRSAEGQIDGAVLVLDDVTQLRRLETIRRDFVANVSHELKTPIAAIQGLVETLQDFAIEDPRAARDFLERIRKQCVRVGALVSDLLSLSRLEAEGIALDSEPLDLRHVVRESLRAVAPVAEARRIRLGSELDEAPVVVLGDEEALRQAVMNLLDNAVKYSPEDREVVVRARRTGRRATLEVEDDGIGIDSRHQQRIFERFYRVDKARSREVGGTGLGLAIVKHTALCLGGEVSVHSAPGEGSIFRIELPLAESTDVRPVRRGLEKAG